MQNMIVIGTSYAVPKILEALYQKPEEQNTESVLHRLRATLSQAINLAASNLGEKGCFICQEVVGDNLWISEIALAVLLQNRPFFEKSPVESLAFLLSGSALSWVVRYGLASALSSTNSSLSPCIAPRNFPINTESLVAEGTADSLDKQQEQINACGNYIGSSGFSHPRFQA